MTALKPSVGSNPTPSAIDFSRATARRKIIAPIKASELQYVYYESERVRTAKRPPSVGFVAEEKLRKCLNNFMKLGIILQSNKPEHAWNAFRLGITALKAGHYVEIFLMSEGSELDTIPDSKDFDVSVKVKEFKELKGKIYACGSCLKVRGKEESNICPISTMSDLLKMVESSDKVLVFG